MADPTLDVLQQQLDALQGQYALRFANQPRITRDLPTIDSIIEGIKRVISAAQEINDATAREIANTAKERLDLYTAERNEIARAQQDGPDARRASELGSLANIVFGRYRRHFAGKDRRTRDLGLLGEMITDLTAIQNEMRALQAKVPGAVNENLDIVSSNLEMYTAERGEIVSSINSAATLSANEVTDLLGTRANLQFDIYRVLFANRSRTTRRPESLQRIIDNLEQTLDRMKGQSYISDVARSNIKIVSDRVALYREELAKIKTTQKLASLDDLVDSLRFEVDAVMNEYRSNFAGQDRATRNLDLLSGLVDRLIDVEKLMRKLAQTYTTHERNNVNLAITRDTLAMFDREYRLIEEAKQGGNRT